MTCVRIQALHTLGLSFNDIIPGWGQHVRPYPQSWLFICPIVAGKFQCSPTDQVDTWPWAVLKGEIWKQHGEAAGNARPYVPVSIDRPPRNIAEKVNSGYKAKEWQGYLVGIAPALLYGVLPMAYWQFFCKLIYATRILHQRTISMADLLEAQACLGAFHTGYEELLCPTPNRSFAFVRPCIHAMLHLGLEALCLGPPNIILCMNH